MTDPTNPNGEQQPESPFSPQADAPGSAPQPNFGQQPGYDQQPNYGAPEGGQYGQPQYGAPGQPQYGAPGGFAPQQISPQEEVEQAKNGHMFSAVGAIFGWGWLVALIFHLTQKDKGPFVRQETAKALNFQLSMVIYAVAGYILATVLLIILIGAVLYLIPLAAWAMGIIFGFTNASKVGQGGVSKYPLTINMFK